MSLYKGRLSVEFKRLYRESIAAEESDARLKLNLAVLVLEYKDGDLGKSAEIVRQIDTNAVKGDSQSLFQYNILKILSGNILNNRNNFASTWLLKRIVLDHDLKYSSFPARLCVLSRCLKPEMQILLWKPS